jgi:hypothetical protein
MSAFSDIELEWGSRIYTIKSHRVMGAIARIEDIITLPELKTYQERRAAPLGKLSMAYGAVLRYAGVNVRDDEVYETVFSGTASNHVIVAIMNIMQMMIPKSALAQLDAADPKSSENDLGNSGATAAASSKKRTKQRSRRGNG